LGEIIMREFVAKGLILTVASGGLLVSAGGVANAAVSDSPPDVNTGGLLSGGGLGRPLGLPLDLPLLTSGGGLPVPGITDIGRGFGGAPGAPGGYGGYGGRGGEGGRGGGALCEFGEKLHHGCGDGILGAGKWLSECGGQGSGHEKHHRGKDHCSAKPDCESEHHGKDGRDGKDGDSYKPGKHSAKYEHEVDATAKAPVTDSDSEQVTTEQQEPETLAQTGLSAADAAPAGVGLVLGGAVLYRRCRLRSQY
jgi:hypothetical protein